MLQTEKKTSETGAKTCRKQMTNPAKNRCENTRKTDEKERKTVCKTDAGGEEND